MVQTSDSSPISDSAKQQRAPYSIDYKIKLLSQLLSRRFSEHLEHLKLTPFHWVVLCCLWEEDGLPTSSIGEKLKQVGGTLTGVIDRMEERGLVRRERNMQDRRVWRIWLTDEGRELETVLPPIVEEIRQQAMHGFSDGDRQLFSQLLNKAVVNLS
ncbi:MAG: MarR family transcriptional regulator [Rivularia sp. (in: cyanobacteria)]|jgi:DNA-binding MarR family transcriptional regulator